MIDWAKSPSLVMIKSPSVFQSSLPTGKSLALNLLRKSATRGRPSGSLIDVKNLFRFVKYQINLFTFGLVD